MRSSFTTRRLLPLVVLACALALPALQARRQAPSAADIVNRVKADVAPDTRVTVFTVKAEAKGETTEVTGEVGEAATRDRLLAALREGGFTNVTDKVAVLPDPALGERGFAVVTVSVANMKSRPSHPAELGNQLLMGTAVTVLKREGGWYFVQSREDRYLGWVEPDQLALMTREELDAYQAPRHLVVTALFALVRSKPSSRAMPVTDIVAGDILRLKGRSGAWYRVQIPDGRSGYVAAADGAVYESWKTTRRPTPRAIEATARLFLGVPYLWGGTSGKGVDCSGFTKTVFRLHGIGLQRDADQQSEQGEAVPIDNDLAQVRKGDLLFFGPRPGVTRITHVGICLGGRRFIHASGMVRVNSLDPSAPDFSENLLKRLVNVRRILPGK